MDDLKLINSRLQELNKEFRDLSALKKKIQDENNKANIAAKYGEYKFMIKSSTSVEPIDFDKLLADAELQVGRNEFGLPVIAYNFGNGLSYFPIVKTTEEANPRLALDKLLTISDTIKDNFKQDQSKTNDVNALLNLFEEALEIEVRGAVQINTDSEDVSE
jgi:hypothetical protein